MFGCKIIFFLKTTKMDNYRADFSILIKTYWTSAFGALAWLVWSAGNFGFQPVTYT